MTATVPPEVAGRFVIPEAPYFHFFDPAADPVWRVPTSRSVMVDAVDGWVGLLRSEDDVVHELPENQTNACTGPIAILGARSGDTLVVHIDAVEPRSSYGVSGLMQGWGVLGHMLPEPRTRILPIDDGQVRFRDGISLPVAPMIGTIGVAPADEAIPTITSGAHGGNMDIREMGAGSTLYLPVSVDGALFGLGDAKVLSADGEVAAAAVEVPISADVRFELMRARTLPSPVIRTAKSWITVGNEDTLEAGSQSAVAAMVTLLRDALGLDWTDAYHLCGLVGSLRISQAVNPRVTVTVHIQREVLPTELIEGPTG